MSPTSGSIDFTLTRNQIIIEALEQLQVVGPGKTPTAEDIATCARTLNMRVKALQAKEIGLWLIDTVALFFTKNATSYDLYSAGAHATASWVKTEVKVAASAADLTIDVDSITGISNSDNIGIELDDGALQWTTVNGVPAGDTVTITAALTDDVAVDNHVYVYTTKINKPLEILDVQFHNSDDTEYPIEIRSRDEYKSLSDKASTGSCTLVYPDMRTDRCTLYTWPVADSVKSYLKLSVKRIIEDFDSLSNNADFPNEWLLALALDLAYWVSPKFGVPGERRAGMKIMAEEALQEAIGFDAEDVSIFIEPR